MIRKATIESIILNFQDKFRAKDIYLKNRMIFDQEYSEKKSLNYITVVLHDLWKAKKIKKVKRGVFTNSKNYTEVDFSDWNSVIKFYCTNDNGFVAREWLWQKYGLIDEFPKKLTIYSNMVSRPKKTGNIEVKPTKIPLGEGNIKIFELFELVQVADFRLKKHFMVIDGFIKENKLKFDDIKAYNKFFKRRFAKIVKNYEFKK